MLPLKSGNMRQLILKCIVMYPAFLEQKKMTKNKDYGLSLTMH
jgi:hypothetical protein